MSAQNTPPDSDVGADAGVQMALPGDAAMKLVKDIPVTLSIELGRTRMSLKDLLALEQGAVIELERMVDEPMDVLVNGTLVAHGEVVEGGNGDVQGRGGKVRERDRKGPERPGRLEGRTGVFDFVDAARALDEGQDAPEHAGGIDVNESTARRGQRDETASLSLTRIEGGRSVSDVAGHPVPVLHHGVGVWEDRVIDALDDVPPAARARFQRGAKRGVDVTAAEAVHAVEAIGDAERGSDLERICTHGA